MKWHCLINVNKAKGNSILQPEYIENKAHLCFCIFLQEREVLDPPLHKKHVIATSGQCSLGSCTFEPKKGKVNVILWSLNFRPQPSTKVPESLTGTKITYFMQTRKISVVRAESSAALKQQEVLVGCGCRDIPFIPLCVPVHIFFSSRHLYQQRIQDCDSCISQCILQHIPQPIHQDQKHTFPCAWDQTRKTLKSGHIRAMPKLSALCSHLVK